MIATLRLLTLILIASAASAADTVPRQLRDFPETSLTITRTDGRDSFRVWIADTPVRQQQGLMFVRELPADRGMLFPQRQPRVMSMWMKNTYIPLSVAFLDAEGTIINIADMQPHSEQSHCATRPALYALEMEKGWFAQRGIKAGLKLGGLSTAPR